MDPVVFEGLGVGLARTGRVDRVSEAPEVAVLDRVALHRAALVVDAVLVGLAAAHGRRAHVGLERVVVKRDVVIAGPTGHVGVLGGGVLEIDAVEGHVREVGGQRQTVVLAEAVGMVALRCRRARRRARGRNSQTPRIPGSVRITGVRAVRPATQMRTRRQIRVRPRDIAKLVHARRHNRPNRLTGRRSRRPITVGRGDRTNDVAPHVARRERVAARRRRSRRALRRRADTRATRPRRTRDTGTALELIRIAARRPATTVAPRPNRRLHHITRLIIIQKRHIHHRRNATVRGPGTTGTTRRDHHARRSRVSRTAIRGIASIDNRSDRTTNIARRKNVCARRSSRDARATRTSTIAILPLIRVRARATRPRPTRRRQRIPPHSGTRDHRRRRTRRRRHPGDGPGFGGGRGVGPAGVSRGHDHVDRVPDIRCLQRVRTRRRARDR